MKNNISSLIATLLDNDISIIAVGVGTYQKICFCFESNSELNITNDTVDLKKSPAANLLGAEVFLNTSITDFEFKFGIEKNNKINWSIPISLNETPENLVKIIKLKNYW